MFGTTCEVCKANAFLKLFKKRIDGQLTDDEYEDFIDGLLDSEAFLEQFLFVLAERKDTLGVAVDKFYLVEDIVYDGEDKTMLFIISDKKVEIVVCDEDQIFLRQFSLMMKGYCQIQ